MDLKTFLCALLVLGILGTSLAAPAPSRCANECFPAVNPKFNYAQGKVYHYTYQAETGLNVVGAIKETPGFKIKANAEFHAVSPCEIVLKLTNVQLTGSYPATNTGDFKKALEDKTLVFSHSDGRVDNVCPDAQDPAWVVNFKRAIVSSFQNSMDNRLETHTREVDVIGQCNTHYTTDGTTITKTKDVLSCTNRVGNVSALQAEHYPSYSDIQSVPLLDSTYTCTHTISDSVTTHVNCKEVHRYRPYSKGEKAATTETTVKLDFTKSGKSSIKIPQDVLRSNLLFDHNDENTIKPDVQDTNNVLKKLCQNYDKVEIGDDAAPQYTRLVYLIRRLTKEQLNTILQSLPNLCPASSQKLKDTFIGALAGAGTEEAAYVLFDVAKTSDISPARIRLWSLSFAFIKKPSLKFIDLLSNFISTTTFDTNVELSGSTIVHTYCLHHPDCHNEASVKKILDFFGGRLQGKCITKSEEEEDKIISALKAFGNIGHVEQHAPLIYECVKNPAVKVPIRLAAVQSLRRVAGTDDHKAVGQLDNIGNKLYEVLSDVSQDTEVRIALYLLFSKLPSPKFYKRLSNLLEHEVVNQVTSFIYTHINNIKHTDSPLKREIHELAQDVKLVNKFHKDIRKFSRNYDLSHFSEEYNFGTDLEANVIFSPESFLPRSTSLNFTVDLFGSAINLFELEFRAEHFEYLLEKYFGPAGKVATTQRSELHKQFKDKWRRISEGIESSAGTSDGHRHKRELPYKAQKLRELQDKAGFKPSNTPEGSVSLKVFGNELIYRHFHGLEEVYDKNNPFHVKEILEKLAKHKEFDVTRNWMFLDATYSVPTASGLPLRLDINGTISLGLKLKSHFDIRQFLLRPRSSDIKSFIQPSANLETAASLYLDAHVAKTGIKFNSNLYSAGAIDGTFQLKEGESLVANLDFPTPSQKIIELKTNSYVIQNDVEKPTTPINPNRYNIHGCTPGKSGLELCSDFSIPKPLFDKSRPFLPMGGPIRYNIILNKKDPGFQGFHFTALWKRDKGAGDEIKNTELKLSFDTPGSSIPHEYTVDYQLNRDTNLLRVNLRSPKFKVGLNGNYVNEDTKKEANLKLNINDEREYSISGKAKVDTKGNTKVYNGEWEISHPNAAPTKITGKITRTIGKKIEFDLKSDSSSPKQVALKGFVQRDGPLDPQQSFTASCDLQVVLPIIETKIVGSFENHHEGFETNHKMDLNVDYNLKSEGQKRNFVIKLNSEAKLDREAHEFKLKRDLEFRSTRFPHCNVQYKFKIEKINQEYHSLLDAKWGENFDDVNKKVFYEHTHKYQVGARGAYEGSGHISFIYPKRHIDWNIDSKVNYQPKKSLDYDLSLKYAQDKTIKLSVEYKNSTTRLANYQAEIKLELPNRELVLKDKVVEKAKGEYTGETYIQWQKGEYVTINSSYKNKGTDNAIHHELEATVLLGTKPNPIRKYKIVVHKEPNKVLLSGRVERPDVIYTVDATYDLPSPGSANFNLNLKVPWVEGQVSSKRVPGDFQGKVDLKTYTGRKVVGTTSLKGEGINRALTAELKWDAGRDESKKFSLNADIGRPRKMAANVKGTLNLPNLTVKGTVNYELPSILFNGPHHVFADIDYGTNKKFTLDANINIDKSGTGRRKSHGEIVYSSHYVKDWKLTYDTDFHNLPDERTFSAKFDAECPIHGHYGFNVKYLRGHRKFSLSSDVQYGEGKAAGLGVGYFFDRSGHGHGYDIGGSFKIKTPFPGFQDFEIVLRDAFKHSYEFGEFITDHRVRWAPGKAAGLTVSYDRIHKHGESFELRGKIVVDTPFEKYQHQKLVADINFDRNPRVLLNSNIDAEWGEGKKVSTNLHYTRDGPKIDATLVIDGKKYREDMYLIGNFNNELSAPDAFHTSAYLKNSLGNEITLDGQISLNDEKKTAKINIATNDPNFAVKSISINGQVTRNGNQRIGDWTATWGPGKSIDMKADLTVDNDGSFNGKVKVNSKALDLKDIEVGIERKLGTPNRSYGLHLNFGEDKDVELGLKVTDKPDRTGVTGDGTIKINGEEFITTKIDVLDSATTKNKYGRLLQYTTEIHNPGLAFSTVLVVLSEKGLNPTLKVCSLEGEKCVKVEALIDLNRNEGQDDQKTENNVYAKFTVQDGPGQSRTAGVMGRTYKLRNNKEATFKLIIDEEHSKFLGVSYQKTAKDVSEKQDKRKSYQLILPSRTVEIRSEKTYNNQGYVYALHLLSNSVKEPNKEILFTSDVKISSDGKAYTRIAKITVKHPKFTKDLVVMSNINKPTTGKVLFKQQIDFDLSKDPKKKFSVSIELLDDPKTSNGHNYTATFAIRQPTLKNLDFKLKGHIGRTREARSVGLELNWLTRDGRNYVLSFLNDIDKVQRTIHGFIHSPLRHISWDGDYQKYEDGGIPTYRSHLDLLYNNKVVRSAAIEYSRGPEYNLKYFINPEDKTRLFRLHGGVIDDSTYQWTATRIKGPQTIQDAEIYHHLNNSHLLFNRYTWRPDLLTDIRDAIDSRLDSGADILTEIARNFFSKAGPEVVEKTAGIRDIVKTDLAPFFSFFKDKLVTIGTELKNDWQPLKLTKLRAVLENIFGAFVDTDELVNRLEKRIEAYHLSINTAFSKLADFLGNLPIYVDKLGDAIENAFEHLPEKIQAWRTTIRAKLPEIVDRVRNFLIRVRDFINDFVENQYVSKALAKFREVWDNTLGRVGEWIKGLVEAVIGKGDGTSGLYSRIKGKLYEYAEGDGEVAKVLKGILLAIKSVKEKVHEVLSDVTAAYAEYRESIIQRWTAIYDAADPDLKELIAEIRAVRKQITESGDSHDDRGLKERIRDFVDHALVVSKVVIQKLISSAVFDPKNGRIEFYLPLILPAESIRTLRHEGLSLRRFLNEEDIPVDEIVKRVKRALTSGDILPPFEAHAILIGDQHYVTYDHRFYDFVGKCQYVLTHDLVDQNFSVIVNYVDKQGKPEKSSIVVMSDSHNIEIKSDYKVLLDEQEVELPNQIENTHIHREQHAIKVSNNKGFTLVYDIAHNLVLVNVSGWYFGRLGGLFGNYNNEPSDDFHTPDGQNLTNPTLFANSWEVSNRCVTKDNYASHQTAMFGSEGYLWCHKLFSSDWSPFSKCFPYTPASNYLQACLEEVTIRKGQQEPADTACRIGSAYVDACHHHNVHLKLPSKCLRCSLPNGQKYSHGNVQTLKGADVPKSADIIFILEQKECNRRILLESLDEIAKDLDKELQAGGLTNNHYGIVAFGGEGVQGHAHPHTARGQLFTDARSVVLALKNMGFSGTHPSDAFEAVDLACNYPFRTGVAKAAILFLCDRCSEESQSVDYSKLLHHLLHHGVSLHVLTPEEVIIKSKPQAAQQVIGFDAQTTYKAKDSSQKPLTGEADLRSHIDNVNDVCQKLAQELDGSVFRSDQMGVKKQNLGKSVKTVFSRRVVASAKPSACQHCDCVSGPDGVPIPFCSPCTSAKPKTVLGHDDDDHVIPAPKDRRVKPPARRT